MSKTTFGKALDSAVTQTVLPVVAKPSGRIYGFMLIPATTFDGTETTYETDDGPIPVATVTMPTHGKIAQGREVIGHMSTMPVQQYVAAVWDDNDLVFADDNRAYASQYGAINKPWLQYRNFIDVADSGFAGTFFSQPSSGWTSRLTLGTLVEFLLIGSGSTTVVQPSNPDLETSVSINWNAKISVAALVGECPFFRLNWLQLFNAKLEKDLAGNYVPQRLSVVSVPAGFKAFLVQRPTVVPGTNIFYDTLQIAIIDSSIGTGSYDFEFSVEVVDQPPVTVTLTLEITAS